MKPKTRQEMLRLVESIRGKLDLGLTTVALREASVSQQRETKRPRYQDLPRGVQETGAALARRLGGNRGLPGGTRKQVKPASADDRWPRARPRPRHGRPSSLDVDGAATLTAHTPSVSKRRHSRGSLSPRVARAIVGLHQHGEEAASSVSGSSGSGGIPHDDDLHPRPEPRPVSGQESHRHDLRSTNSDPTVVWTHRGSHAAPSRGAARRRGATEGKGGLPMPG